MWGDGQECSSEGNEMISGKIRVTESVMEGENSEGIW